MLLMIGLKNNDDFATQYLTYTYIGKINVKY